MVGIGAVFAAETFDKTIRGSADLLRIADSSLIVAIPYIATRAETRLKQRRRLIAAALAAALLLALLGAFHIAVMPLDQAWDKLLIRVSR